MRLLITGGAGCLGSNLVEHYLPQNHEVLVIDNFATGQREVVPELPGLGMVEGSIADPDLVEAVFARFAPTHVVHGAASYKDPQNWREDTATNVLGTINVVEAARRVGVRRIVNLQTALCYGRPDRVPIPVEHPTRPFTSYGISKTAGEAYLTVGDLPWVSLRLANISGPRLAIGPIPTFYRRLKAAQACFCTDAVRDFLDMADFLDIMDIVLRDDAPTGIFNVSTGEGHAINEVFDSVAAYLGVTLAEPVPVVPCGADDVPAVVLDPARTTTELGWRAKIGFAETIERMLRWYDAHGVSAIYSHLQAPPGRTGMTQSSFDDAVILVVGGAGFVGSALVRRLLAAAPRRMLIVDNLLSADIGNVPEHAAVNFVFGSIADDRVLAVLPRDLEYVFHLACYHGNQSSIHDPLADHQNNTLTSLKLFDRLKDFPRLKKVVYAGAGCAVAEKTFDQASATAEDAPVSLFHDSPYSISKLIGEMYGNYYFSRYRLPFVRARFQNVYGPGEILGAGRWRGTPHTIWRNVTPTFVWKALKCQALPVENGGIAGRDFIFVEDIARGLIACAERGVPGEAYNLASGIETSILDLARLINQLTQNPTPIALAPARDWDRSGHRFGDPRKARDQLGFATETALRDGLGQTIAWTRANREAIRRCMLQHARFMPDLRAVVE